MFCFVSQPDNLYFIWQVELLLFNLIVKHRYPKHQIHILFGYDPDLGATDHSKRIISKFPDFKIFLYPDTREYKGYPSTIRPHIIEKHFKKYPELRKEAIFYIDSDLIFRCLPDFQTLLKDNKWYASDTKSYMSYEIIVNALGYEVFEKMCNIVGVDSELVKSNNNHTGGAQYIIKDVPEWFWPKVEKDSENIYCYLYDLLFNNTPHNFFSKKFDIWFTEMWVVYWNSILAKKIFEIHKELDFCWANEPIENWNNTKILHYTGVKMGNVNFFNKLNFTFYEPFYADLSYVAHESASIEVVNLINEYRNELNKNRVNLTDTLFIILVKHTTKYLDANINYINKYFDTKILILNISGNSIINDFKEINNINYLNGKDIIELTSSINNSILNLNIQFIISIPSDIIVSNNEIINIIQKMRDYSYLLIFSPEAMTYKMDIVTQFIFNKILDYEFLIQNLGKMSKISFQKFNESPVFLNKSVLNKIEINEILNVNNQEYYYSNFISNQPLTMFKV